MQQLHRLSDVVNRLTILLCALCVLAMLTITFVGSIWQAVTGEALSWTYSLARQFVPWIGFLSITVAFKKSEHVAVNLLGPRLPPAAARLLERAVVLLLWVFALLMIYEGARFFLETRQMVMVSDKIQFSQRWTVASVPVMGVIMLIHATTGAALLEPVRSTSALVDEILAEFDEAESHSGGAAR